MASDTIVVFTVTPVPNDATEVPFTKAVLEPTIVTSRVSPWGALVGFTDVILASRTVKPAVSGSGVSPPVTTFTSLVPGVAPVAMVMFAVA